MDRISLKARPKQTKRDPPWPTRLSVRNSGRRSRAQPAEQPKKPKGPKQSGAAAEFFAGYLIEYSLSVDNMFVFVLIFTYFKVPFRYQHQVLFYGILGAMIFRGIFIVLGVALIQQFEWIIYIFGAFLIYTAFKIARGQEEVHPEDNPILKWAQRRLRATKEYHGQKLFVIENGGVIFDTGDPKDPRLNVQASWRTPQGDVLFVYVTGTLSRPKLNFDRPAAEAYALLGSGDASSLGLNALETLLSDTPLARVQVRTSSGEDAWRRRSAVWRSSRDTSTMRRCCPALGREK